jgi:hypothetical protein
MKHTIELDQAETERMLTEGLSLNCGAVEVTIRATAPEQTVIIRPNGSNGAVSRRQAPSSTRSAPVPSVRKRLKQRSSETSQVEQAEPVEPAPERGDPHGWHACPHCPRRFSNPGIKGNHIKAQHPEHWKPRKSTLNRLDVERIKCAHCKATFLEEHWRQIHVAKFHPDKDQQPFNGSTVQPAPGAYSTPEVGR